MRIDDLLKRAVERGASDLHLVVTSPPALRIDGNLVLQEDLPPLNVEDVELALEQVSTEDQRLAFDKEHELDCAYDAPGLARFRVSAMSQRGAASLNFRPRAVQG